MPYDFKKLSDVAENVTVPEDGKVLYEKDGENDSADNWREVTPEEKAEIEKQQQAEVR